MNASQIARSLIEAGEDDLRRIVDKSTMIPTLARLRKALADQEWRLDSAICSGRNLDLWVSNRRTGAYHRGEPMEGWENVGLGAVVAEALGFRDDIGIRYWYDDFWNQYKVTIQFPTEMPRISWTAT